MSKGEQALNGAQLAAGLGERPVGLGAQHELGCATSHPSHVPW